MKPLTKLEAGECAFIVAMLNAKLSLAFFKHGILPGDKVEVKEHLPDTDSVIVCVGKRIFNIYTKAAETVITSNTGFDMNLN